MTRLAWTLLGAAVVAHAGWAQVRVTAELGWHGQAVVGEVNPLLIAVENGGASLLVAALHVEQNVGSGWRGAALQRIRAPVLLPPGGRTRFVFPWPVDAGSGPLKLVVAQAGAVVAQATVPIRLAVEKPVAVVGAWTPLPGAALYLSADNLPHDPLLLSPFSRVEIGPGTVLSAPTADALRAWAAFGGGRVDGLSVPETVPLLLDPDVRRALDLHAPRPPAMGILIGGTIVYLVLLGYALPPLARRGTWKRTAALVAVSCGVAWFYPVLYRAPQDITSVQYSVSLSDVVRFCMDTTIVAHHRGGWWEGAGWWMERVPVSGARVGGEVEWVWGEGVRTRVRLREGATIVLVRYGPVWTGEGEDLSEARLPGSDPGFWPALFALGPALRAGDRLVGSKEGERAQGHAFYRYQVRWERRG